MFELSNRLVGIYKTMNATKVSYIRIRKYPTDRLTLFTVANNR